MIEITNYYIAKTQLAGGYNFKKNIFKRVTVYSK